jgi:hypothetical protein
MTRRASLKALAAFALALQLPAPAAACRVGWDQHLFQEAPSPSRLTDVETVRVHFSNARPGIDPFPRLADNPDGSVLTHTLIGLARRIDGGAGGSAPFPVYAMVTSCSGFWSMTFGEVRTVVEGEHYLVGRFVTDGTGRRFHAAGRRMSGGGEIYGGWHY